VSRLKLKSPVKLCVRNQQIHQLFIQFINRVVSSDVVRTHNILSTAPQLSISQKALGTLPENGNVMPKHVGVTMHN
jgi:hypothetical protein